MSPLDQLHSKTRRAALSKLAADEDVIAIFEGRSKQAMIVTDRQILIVKPGAIAGAALGAKAVSFWLDDVTAINVHTGPRFAALEVVAAGYQAAGKPDLRTAFQLPNWLPCQRSVGDSPLIGELRRFVRSRGRAQSARAALGTS